MSALVACLSRVHRRGARTVLRGPRRSNAPGLPGGNAPQGLDSASLWGSSLAVPSLADRVRQERRRDFESRDGKLMTLFVCSKILGPYAHPEDPRLEPARRMVGQAIKELQED